MKLNPTKTIDLYMIANGYQGIPKKVRTRYINMLLTRAARFYVENEFDSFIIDEDLADGESDTGFYESGRPLKKTDLCNLIISEKHETDYQKSLK